MLLNLLRGAGTSGLGGMPARRRSIVRPLLDCTHRELVDWLAESGIPFREDETNRDRRFLRNRVRSRILPALTAVVPSASDAIVRAAEITRVDAEFLDELAARELARISSHAGRWPLGRRGRGAGGHADRARPESGAAGAGSRRGRRIPRVRAYPAGARPGARGGSRTRPAPRPAGVPDGGGAARHLRIARGRGRKGEGFGEFRTFLPSRCLFQERPLLAMGGWFRVSVARAAWQFWPRSWPAGIGRPRWWTPTSSRGWPCGPGVAATDSGRSGWRGGRSSRTSSSTGRCRAPSATGCRSWSTADDRIVWVAGHAVSEDFRVTDAHASRGNLET